MEKKAGRAAAELCGAVIGAGFASGREIAAFFARFGAWSWLGVAAAAGVMGWLCLGLMRFPGAAGMPCAWQGKWLGKVWRGMFAALLVCAGGAMLAGSGEVAALMLPLHGARALGLGMALGLAWLLSRGENAWLAAVSRGLILCLSLMMAAGFLLPAQRTVSLAEAGGGALISGLCYGGFNIALAAPVASGLGQGLTHGAQRRCVGWFILATAALLCCGNGVLMRHTALQGENLPFIVLLAPLGKTGFWLGGAALYLASLTTLTACLRGLAMMWPGGRRLALGAVLLLSLGGLEHIVGVVYPLLGGVCFLLLWAARRENGTKT